jgi:hypothetical protein
VKRTEDGKRVDLREEEEEERRRGILKSLYFTFLILEG